MKKRFVSFVALIMASLFLFSVSASGLPSESSSKSTSEVTSTVPSTGTQSSDPKHGTGINNTQISNSGIQPMTSGLIGDISLDIYYESPTLVSVAVVTDGTDIMDKIGANNVSVQYWNDSSWVTIDQRSGSDSNASMYATSYYVSVPSGYLYRAICTHFATKNFLFIPQTQSISNETDYIYVG